MTENRMAKVLLSDGDYIEPRIVAFVLVVHEDH